MPEPNQSTYNDTKIVNYYAYLSQLQPAEQTIIKELAPSLKKMTMLDLGIGAGRTIPHFAPLVKAYTGVDYAEAMVIACQSKYQNYAYPLKLEIADARDLSLFADNSFDFVLFSFNGIDYVGHSDRLKILTEVARVLKPQGYFAFSSHNLIAMGKQFDYRSHLSFNPFKTYINLVIWSFLKISNRHLSGQKLQQKSHTIIKDESHNFRLQTYYIRPQDQIEQLASNFTQTKIYAWQTGELIDLSKPQSSALERDLWLYYLCQNN